MYREESEKQQKLEDFHLPFGGHLDENNRWVILSNKIPWKEIEKDYAVKFAESGMGAPAIPLRTALGALIIKEKLQISDREVVEQIRETPYLQYFIGLDGFTDEVPFDSRSKAQFYENCTHHEGVGIKGNRPDGREPDMQDRAHRPALRL